MFFRVFRGTQKKETNGGLLCSSIRLFLIWVVHRGRALQLEILRDGQLEAEVLASDGMEELEYVVVEHQSANGIGLSAILTVAGNGATQVAHVDANLVLAPREKLDIDLAVVAMCLEHLVTGYGEFALLGVVGAIDLHGGVLGQIATHLALGVGRNALTDSQITSLHDVAGPRVAEHLLHLTVLGKNQDARGILVQTVADIGMAVSVGSIEIVIDNLLRRLLARLSGRHGEEARLLLDDDDVGVFVHQSDHSAVERHEGMGEVDEHFVPRSQRLVELRGGSAVDLDMTVGQDGFHFRTRTGSQHLQQEWQECGRLGRIVHLNMVWTMIATRFITFFHTHFVIFSKQYLSNTAQRYIFF